MDARGAAPAPQAWAGRRVLVTGHTGFKGAWLTLRLLGLGADVSGFALAPETDPSLYELLRLDREVDSTLADLRDQAAVEAAVRRARPEVVFHLAAQPILRTGVEDPLGTYAVNVMGTAHVLDALRRAPSVAAAVIVTSDKCYENVGWVSPYRESDPMGGADPYSSSKGCAELVTAAYRRTYFAAGPAVATARAGNVIGGGDWSPDRIVPDLVRAAVAGVEPVLRFPAAIRPWQHVLDAVEGYLLLAERLRSDGAAFAAGWNFGPTEDSALTVGELTARFQRAWGGAATYREVPEPGFHEVGLLRVDSTRARALLGWRPRFDADAAIERTAAWYRGWHAGADVRALSERQLAGG